MSLFRIGGDITMTKFLAVATLGSALLLTGCFDMPSLYPLYADTTIVFDRQLLGIWNDTDKGGGKLIVEQKSEGVYRATFVADGKATEYLVRLTQLADIRIADMVPGGSDGQIPGHSFARVTLTGDTLELAFLDSGDLRKAAIQENLALVNDGDFVALIAPTPVLRRFLTNHIADAVSSESTTTFTRMK